MSEKTSAFAFSEHGTKFDYYVSELGNMNFDSSGNLGMYAISQWFETARSFPFWHRDGFFNKSHHDINSAGALLTMLVEYRFSRALEKITIFDRLSCHLQFSTKFREFGKTTLTVRSLLTDWKTSELLAESDCMFCLIDSTTRAAKAIPERIKEDFRPYSLPLRVEIFAKFTPPADAFMWPYCVSSSDIDFMNHINNNVHLRLCVDAGSLAVRRGALKNFRDNLLLYRMEKMRVLFAGEGHVDDRLKVFVWDGDKEINTLYFIIEHEDSKQPLFYCTMEFYSDLQSKL